MKMAAINNNNKSKEELKNKFSAMFENRVEKSVIDIVLKSCNYKEDEVYEHLLLMAGDEEEVLCDKPAKNLLEQLSVKSENFLHSHIHSDGSCNSAALSLDNISASNFNTNTMKNDNLVIEELVLIIMRGLPGCGKSTKARKLKGINGRVYSTDDFFYQNGVYMYDITKLEIAHHWNQERAKRSMESKLSPVIIDNTNIRICEMEPYVVMALKNNYRVSIVEPYTSWAWKPNILAKVNVHGVSKVKIEQMMVKYEVCVKVEDIVRRVNTEVGLDDFKIDGNDCLQQEQQSTKIKENVQNSLPSHDDFVAFNIQFLCECFPSYSREYLRGWFERYNEDLMKTCDYLSRLTQVDIDSDISTATPLYDGDIFYYATESTGGLKIAIDNRLGTELFERFGNGEKFELTDDDYIIDVKDHLAKELYGAWLDTLTEKKKLSKNKPGYSGGAKLRDHAELTYKEISSGNIPPIDEARNRKEIHGMFPWLEIDTLQQILESCGYDVALSTETIRTSWGMEKQLEGSLASTEKSKPAEIEEPRASLFQNTSEECQDYVDLRAEAALHRNLRIKYFQNAAKAFQEKNGILAQQYAKDAWMHTSKMKDANRRAAKITFERRNKTYTAEGKIIDLHGLHVNEAIEALQIFFENAVKVRHKVVFVISGRGKHSPDHNSPVRNAVLQYLNKHLHRYELMNNGGMIRVTLH